MPPYLFAEVDRRIAEKRAAGFDVISLGIGDPDLPSPPHVVEAAQEAVADPRRHRYPDYYGLPEFRAAIARWYQRRFEVTYELMDEVVASIEEVRAEGDGALAQLFDLILLGDTTSIHRALREGVDPGPTPALQRMKDAVASDD